MTTSIVGMEINGMEINGMENLPIGYWPRTRLFSENNQISLENDFSFPMFADSFPARIEDDINQLPLDMDTDEPEDLLSDASADSASSAEVGKRSIIDSPPVSIICPNPPVLSSHNGFSLLRDDDDIFVPQRWQETPIIPKKADDFLKNNADDFISKKKKREKSFSLALQKAYHDGWAKVSTTDLPGKKPPKKLIRDKSTKTRNRRKQPKLKSRWTLFCTHCGDVFLARPTPKNSRYVVNHVCSDNEKKRRQFVLGVKSRRCNLDHEGPCVHRIVPGNQLPIHQKKL